MFAAIDESCGDESCASCFTTTTTTTTTTSSNAREVSAAGRITDGTNTHKHILTQKTTQQAHTGPPVNYNLLQPFPVFIEGDKVNPADVALVESGLVRVAGIVCGWLQVGAVALPVHKAVLGVTHTNLCSNWTGREDMAGSREGGRCAGREEGRCAGRRTGRQGAMLTLAD